MVVVTKSLVQTVIMINSQVDDLGEYLKNTVGQVLSHSCYQKHDLQTNELTAAKQHVATQKHITVDEVTEQTIQDYLTETKLFPYLKGINIKSKVDNVTLSSAGRKADIVYIPLGIQHNETGGHSRQNQHSDKNFFSHLYRNTPIKPNEEDNNCALYSIATIRALARLAMDEKNFLEPLYALSDQYENAVLSSSSSSSSSSSGVNSVAQSQQAIKTLIHDGLRQQMSVFFNDDGTAKGFAKLQTYWCQRRWEIAHRRIFTWAGIPHNQIIAHQIIDWDAPAPEPDQRSCSRRFGRILSDTCIMM